MWFWNNLWKVLRRPAYFLVAGVVAFVVFTLAVWLPNLSLIGIVLSSDTASFPDKIGFLLSLYGSISTNFTIISATYTVMISILFGINISLLAYYINSVRGGSVELQKTGVAGIGGLIFGLFGIGCAACGTFVLSSLLALFGATGLLAFLPFGGQSLAFIGVALLIYSIYSITRKMKSPLVCEAV